MKVRTAEAKEISFDSDGLAWRRSSVSGLAGVRVPLLSLLSEVPEAQRIVKLRATLYDLLGWVWLEWHGGTSLSELQAELSVRGREGFEFIEGMPSDEFGILAGTKNLLLHVAILSRSEALIKQAVSIVIAPSPEDPFPFVPWARVLAHVMRDEWDAARAQADVFSARKMDRVRPAPSVSLLGALARRDADSARKQVRLVLSKYSKEAERLGAVGGDTAGVRCDPRKLHLHFLWPWAEATVLRVFPTWDNDGVFHPLWLPRSLVGHEKKSGTGPHQFL